MVQACGTALAPAFEDPARHFENAEFWFTSWKYRFLPSSYLLDAVAEGWDQGLENLLYLQSLINEEAD